MLHPARLVVSFVLLIAGLLFVAVVWPGAASSSPIDSPPCPPGVSVPVTGGARGSAAIVLTGLGPAIHAAFFTVGSADLNNSGELPASDWVVPIGDVDGDGIPDYRVEAPGQGPGGWGDSRTHGCPATANPEYPPVAIVLWHEREDRTFPNIYYGNSFDRPGDGRFDVFEDRNGNGNLDPGEDADGDGYLTSPDGCEGVLREDVDCDGRLDTINEDDNSNGILDPGEDRDGDHRLDAIEEDRNGNGVIDWFDANRNGVFDYGEPTEDGNLNGRLDHGRYIEDRNNDQMLNDRVAPEPDDSIYEVTLGGTRLPLPATYPYGSFKPARGGLVVVSVAWNGTAYDLTRISNFDLETIRPAEGFEDLDGDGAFDVFEDRDMNGRLDPGEDWDGDGRVTPPDGCEGVLREDVDCDGRLDTINEDDNSNGILDPGEDRDGDRRLDRIEEDRDRDGFLDPGEDTNVNGRLDTGGWIEDRNRNQELDDRPSPDSSDVLFEVLPDGSIRPIPATYPYGTFTPTGMVRVVPARRLEHGAPRGSGMRGAGSLAWRMQVGVPPLMVHADQEAPRPIFSHLRVDLICEYDYLSGERSGCLPYRFLEEGTGSTVVLLAVDGEGWATRTLVHTRTHEEFPWLPAQGILLAAGTTGPYDPGMPRQLTENLIDHDWDHAPIPEDSCPAEADILERDLDGNGVVDICDRRLEGNDLWTRATSSTGPGRRAGAAATYDEGRGVVVLFGGADDPSTWEWNGSDWLRVATATNPGPRRGHRMVYDTSGRRVILFGGKRLADGTTRGDLWVYDGLGWREVVVPFAPPARTEAGLAFDSDRGRLVLFGGHDEGHVFGDTWEFDGATWRRRALPQSPASRTSPQMTYDALHRVVVLQGGGTDPSQVDLNDTWEFDGTAWQPVDHRDEVTRTVGGSMHFDPIRRQAVMFGGKARIWNLELLDPRPYSIREVGTARLFDGPTWSILHAREAPRPRRDHAAAFDTRRGLLVVHGGTGPDGTLGDTVVLSRSQDTDADGVPDRVDNCPLIANPDQRDADGDLSGDPCDNCGMAFNPTQRDLDRDGAGDACDDDRDGDRVANGADVCPDSYIAGRPFCTVLQGGGADSDGDGTADDCDFCPADPDDDADDDGVCGDADNCPLVANPLQEDSGGDGHGDVCQTVVRLSPVRSQGEGALSTRVLITSPDGDPVTGQVAIFPTHIVPDVLPRFDQGCDLAFHPDGVAGEGIVYAAHPSSPTIADADEAFGCTDGAPDFAFAVGTCAEVGSGGTFQTVLTILTPAPYNLCVKRLSGVEAFFDYLVWSIGGAEMVLVPSAVPVIAVPYTDSRLPRTVNLGALPGAGRYILKVTAADGTTPEASDQVLFARDRQQTLHLIQRRDRHPPL